MSVQIFLQGKLLGIDDFLLSPAGPDELACAGECGEALLVGRSHWVSLLTEVLPRALLAELGLARILLGSSGGGQFLVVLPEEAREAAEEFLTAAAADAGRMSRGRLRLVWAVTENLGDWSIVRRRLNEAMRPKRDAPATGCQADCFEPFIDADHLVGDYFPAEMGVRLKEARGVGWSPERPAAILLGEGKHSWPLGNSPEAIPLARHAAPTGDHTAPASPRELARHAEGRKLWGVLRGDVDNLEIRLRRLQSIEEHVQLSVLYKQFFAGEVEVLCSMPEFWRRVSVIYSGGDDFAVFGAWDALIPLAREIQRLFHRFSEENLKEFPGAEGKTISMAIALAPPAGGATLAEVFEAAGRNLEIAKSADKDCVFLFGRVLEWRQLAHAAELKDNLGRLVREYDCPPELLGEMTRMYRESDLGGSAPGQRFDRPWRYYRRLSMMSGGARDRELQKLRSRLLAELVGKNAAQARLRPAGRVALQWAQLLTEA